MAGDPSAPTGAIDWPALLRVCLHRFGLAPEAFWRLTPKELAAGLGAPAHAPLGPADLAALLRRWPDDPRNSIKE